MRTFDARPTGEPGVYRAEVVFPRAGRWEYEVNDGFVDETHTFAPVEIAAAGAGARPPRPAARPTPCPRPADDGGGDRRGAGWPARALALAAAAGVLAFDRRRRRPGAVPGGAPEPA